ncbi:rCG43802, isoform CRA_b [Rattus norvegicus]|uniref:RCG43802, isoform CRA_b n=1 Tax=Rattus norvegicus TaxID=10116 RepID=A6KRP7_RAT|nr:rCG43802, isoform CRA_b [Rattus norvegicus]
MVERAAIVEKLPSGPEQEEEGEESLRFDLMVPFLTFVDAETSWYRTRDEESLEGAVHG